MRKQLMLVGVAAAMTLASVSAAFADIMLKPIICPFPADAAFEIVGAKGEVDGVGSEYQWLGQERPGWVRDDQATLDDSGRIYDMLTISKGSQKETICFDITDFFGKM